jgi:hypothetical protein
MPQEACDTGAASDLRRRLHGAGLWDWSVNGAVGETCDDGNVATATALFSVRATTAPMPTATGIGDGCDDCVATPDGAVLSVLGLRNIGTDPVVGDDGLGSRWKRCWARCDVRRSRSRR